MCYASLHLLGWVEPGHDAVDDVSVKATQKAVFTFEGKDGFHIYAKGVNDVKNKNL